MNFLKHGLALLVGFTLPILVTYFILLSSEGLFRKRKYDALFFDSKKWKARENLNGRFQMLKDLQYYYLANGMKVEEVTGLLGSPDQVKGDSIVGFDIGSPGILAFKQKLIFKVADQRIRDFSIE